MEKKEITLYDIDCEVKIELGLKPTPPDSFHGNISLENKDIDTFRTEWKDFIIRRQKIFKEKEGK